MGDFSELFNKALNNIYKELVDVKGDIEPNLFKATFETLNKAVDKGFGSISYDHPDFGFVNELKANNGVFAAFKTHRQQNDIAKQLLDENGNLKSFDQFRKDTEAIIGEYNRNWLKTEYDTAVIRARMAARFKEFQRDADLYPNLKWTESTSVVKREPHVILYGLILPITHPFWLQQYPGSLWSCKCGITNTDEPENSTSYHLEKYDIPTPPAGLEGNPAFTGEIYSNGAYEQNAYPGAEQAMESFLQDELAKFAVQLLKEWRGSIDQFKGVDYAGEKLVTGNLKVLRRTIDDVRGHREDFKKILYLTDVEGDIKNWKYLGWKPVEHGHPEALFFTYYEASIDSKKSYMVVKLHRDYKQEVLYCIVDKKPVNLKNTKIPKYK